MRRGRFLPYYTLNEQGEPVLDPLYSYVVDDPDSYYFVPMRSLKPHVTDIYLSRILDDEELMFTISWPVFSHGEFAGVALADVGLSDEKRLVESIDFFGDAGTMFLLSTHQRVIAHTRAKESGGRPIAEVDSLHAPSEAEMAVLYRGESHMRISADELVIFYPLFLAGHSVPMVLGMAVDRAAVFAEVRSQLMLYIVVGVVLSLLFGFVLARLLKVQQTPLYALTRSLDRVSQGELTPLSSRASSRADELGVMSRSIDTMLGILREIVRAIRSTSLSIDRSADRTREYNELFTRAQQDSTDALREVVEQCHAMRMSGGRAQSSSASAVSALEEALPLLEELREAQRVLLSNQDVVLEQVNRITDMQVRRISWL